MSSLIRALSWPLISQSQGGGGGPGGPGGPGSPLDGLDGLGNGAGHCKKNGGIPPSPTFQQLMAARRLLCRRYYPEGGWGWVVIVVGILVHTMTHGLQLSYGPLMANVMRYFGKPFTDTGVITPSPCITHTFAITRQQYLAAEIKPRKQSTP
uniref:Monocarboxylate transporter n=1 Tax=Anopheles quadriannulatus TaxID=34691 RepID=A0A182X5A8_ANOQN